MKYLEKIQALLPLGYLYLMILGLLKESVLFYQLGINILTYSSITDILISPISEMTSSPLLLTFVISFCIFFLIIQMVLVKNSHTNWAKKILGQNRFSDGTTKKEMQKFLFPYFTILIAFELLFVFVGVGIGEGHIISQKIIKNDLKINYKISFSSGESQEIYMIDLNSSYYFYVAKGSKNIKIAPIGTISNLELINNKKLQ